MLQSMQAKRSETSPIMQYNHRPSQFDWVAKPPRFSCPNQQDPTFPLQLHQILTRFDAVPITLVSGTAQTMLNPVLL